MHAHRHRRKEAESLGREKKNQETGRPAKEEPREEHASAIIFSLLANKDGVVHIYACGKVAVILLTQGYIILK